MYLLYRCRRTGSDMTCTDTRRITEYRIQVQNFPIISEENRTGAKQEKKYEFEWKTRSTPLLRILHSCQHKNKTWEL